MDILNIKFPGFSAIATKIFDTFVSHNILVEQSPFMGYMLLDKVPVCNLCLGDIVSVHIYMNTHIIDIIICNSSLR